MSPRDEWFGHYERMRHEAKKFAEMAAARRKEAIEFRRRRLWLEALTADDLAYEYRKERDNRKAEAEKIARQWGFGRKSKTAPAV